MIWGRRPCVRYSPDKRRGRRTGRSKARNEVFFEIGRQALLRLLIIASEGNIEGDDILHFALVDSMIADGRAGSYKPMEHRILRLLGIT